MNQQVSTSTVTPLLRVFKFNHNGNELILADPDPGRTPEQVMQFYSNQYPELTNAKVSAPVHGDGNVVFEFKSAMGTKG